MIHWYQSLEDASPTVRKSFGSLDEVFALQGQKVAKDPLSEVILVSVDGQNFYVKRYWRAAKNPLRTWLGRPRVKAEWENLQRFASWGLTIPSIVAYGLERHRGAFVRGAFITAEVENSQDLTQLVESKAAILQDPAWLRAVLLPAVQAIRVMHEHGFAHNDLRWRNLLIQLEPVPRVFFIDCPAGQFWPWPLLKPRVLKDMAAFDKDAQRSLSRTWRLRLYLAYANKKRLARKDKQLIRKLIIKNHLHRLKNPD